MKTRFRILLLIALLGLLVGLLPAQLVSAAPSEQRATVASPIMIVNTSFLNIRTGPGIEYSTLITVVGGTTLPVLGVAEDRVWYQVSTVVGVGWVNSQYVLARGNFANVPLAEAPPLIDDRAIIVSDDTAVDFGFSTQREWGVSVTVDQPLRYDPSINSAQIQGLGPDTRLIFTVVGATFAEGVPWIQIQLPDGKVGWLEQPKVTFRPFACELSAVLITQNVDLKKGPDGSGPDSAVYVSQGQEVYLLNRIDNQFQIELIDGTVGWVDISFIQVRDRASVYSQYCANGGFASRSNGAVNSAAADDGVARASIPRVIINTGYLNIRSGPGAQYTSVIALPGGTELSVLGRAPDGVWYLVQGPFGQGWLNIDFVLFRGDGSRLPTIRNAVGEVATPKATVNRPTATLYAAPNLTLGVVGTLTQDTVVDVVARTADSLWIQVDTDLGFGWIQADFITLSGDTGMIPVVS
jgi:uncharacterized protein YraI